MEDDVALFESRTEKLERIERELEDLQQQLREIGEVFTC